MTNTTKIKITAISGSIKLTSSNTNILRAIAIIAPENVAVTILEGLDKLPHFNPETKEEILTVNKFRQQLKESDGIIFSTPEYAFGIPGLLKNALDWLVFSGELNEKPVAAISASPLYSGGEKALASLILTLTALGANIGTGSSLSIANIKNKMNQRGEIEDAETMQALQLLLNGLINKITAV